MARPKITCYDDFLELMGKVDVTRASMMTIPMDPDKFDALGHAIKGDYTCNDSKKFPDKPVWCWGFKDGKVVSRGSHLPGHCPHGDYLANNKEIMIHLINLGCEVAIPIRKE